MVRVTMIEIEQLVAKNIQKKNFFVAFQYPQKYFNNELKSLASVSHK